MKSLLIILVFTSLCFAQDNTKLLQEKQLPSFNSFIDYTPTTAEYGSDLHFIVENLVTAKDALQTDNRLEAEPYLETAVTQSAALRQKATRGKHDEILFLQGYALELLGKGDDAVTAYREALKRRSSFSLAAFRLALILKQQKKCTESTPIFREVFWRADGHEEEVLFQIAECQLTLGEKEKALKTLQTAYAKAPNYVPVLNLMVNTRLEQLSTTSDPAQRSIIELETMADLERITSQNKTDRKSALLLAGLLSKHSDPLISPHKLDRAGEIVKQFVVDSKYSDEDAVKTLFDIYIKQQNLDAADKLLKQGFAAKPQSQILQTAAKQLAIEQGLGEPRPF